MATLCGPPAHFPAAPHWRCICSFVFPHPKSAHSPAHLGLSLRAWFSGGPQWQGDLDWLCRGDSSDKLQWQRTTDLFDQHGNNLPALFPLKQRGHILAAFGAAIVSGYVINTIRIALLAYFTTWEDRSGMAAFDFFHGHGGLIFSLIAATIAGWIYYRLLDQELAA